MDDNNQNSENSTEREQLEALKRQALQVLVPLIDQIEGAPEQRFELLMLAARSSGDSTLLHKTLEVAQQVENPTAKANAVVDVLNEINYHLGN